MLIIHREKDGKCRVPWQDKWRRLKINHVVFNLGYCLGIKVPLFLSRLSALSRTGLNWQHRAYKDHNRSLRVKAPSCHYSILKMAEDNLTLLREKWRFWFNWLDINGDGALTSADWEQGAKTMIEEHQLNEDHAEVALASYRRIGSLLLGQNMKNQTAVTVDEFVDNLTKFYEQDSTKAQEYIFNVIRQLFLVADVNRDALISEDEFIILMKSFGIKRENAHGFYKEFKQANRGRVPMQEAINWWVDVWFGTDREQWEKVKKMHD